MKKNSRNAAITALTSRGSMGASQVRNLRGADRFVVVVMPREYTRPFSRRTVPERIRENLAKCWGSHERKSSRVHESAGWARFLQLDGSTDENRRSIAMADESKARSTRAHRAAKRYIYAWGGGKAEGSGAMRDLLGGKGAGLAEMARARLPVPPGFTITTEACNDFFAAGERLPPGLWDDVRAALAALEVESG